MKRIHILLLVLGGIAAAGCAATTAPERPNIVIIMADDMGFSDIGVYGGEIRTPNIDRLAENGLRFRQFYNTARCCPTRASLLTGLYPHQAGMGRMVSSVDSDPEPGPYQGYLNDRSATIAELLRPAGYSTYMSGKWHVGEKPEHWPTRRGFERYFGLISGASSYFTLIQDQPRVRQMALDGEPWQPPAEGFYMTDAITDHAVQVLREHADASPEKPFFHYVSYTAPHWPLHALPEDIERYDGRYDGGWDSLRSVRYERMREMKLIDDRWPLSPRDEDVPAWQDVTDRDHWIRRMEVYAAMVDRMDQGIGRIIEALEAQGELDNTVIFFLSDNGASAEEITGRNLNDPKVPIGQPGSYVAYRRPWANASNTPLRLYKQWTHEGGIATPLVVHWPAGIAEGGGFEDAVGHVIDLMPTALEVAGVPYPDSLQGNALTPLQGASLVPALRGERAPERTLYWEHFDNRAIRKGDWKLSYERREGRWKLYNLREERTEITDLASSHPDRVRELEAEWLAWATRVGVFPQP